MESFMRRLSLPALSQAEKIAGAFNFVWADSYRQF
jgi:hypothetical protein